VPTCTEWPELASIKRGKADELIEQAVEAVKRWPDLAAKTAIDETRVERIQHAHRIHL